MGFSVSCGGRSAEGGLARYVARIRFDPDRLSQSSAIVAIDLGSVGTGQKAVDETLRSAEWFDVASHPQALFTASRFEKQIGRATSELQSLMRISYAVFCLQKRTAFIAVKYVYATIFTDYIRLLQHT